MAGLVPAIHVFVSSEKEGVDARIKSGHDDGETSVSRRHRTTLPATAFRPGDPKFIRPKGRGECRGPNAPADGVTGLLALRAVVPHMMV